MAAPPAPPPVVLTNPNLYPGLYNSEYNPLPMEAPYLNTPEGMLGPWLMASALCMLLAGIMLCQALVYVRNYHSVDRAFTKYLVYIVVLFCSAKAGHLLYIAWVFFVSEFGNYLRASIATPSIKLTALESSITGAIVQGFYIHRTFTLSRSWIFLALTIPTLILGVTGCLIMTILVFDLTLLIKNTVLLNAAANMMVSCVVICDVFITGFTAHYLLKTKTGFKETNQLIMRLLQTAIQAALPPTICAIINLALNSQAKQHAWVNLFNSLMPFLYAISMLYTLNSRREMRKGSSNVSSSNAYELRSGSKGATGRGGYPRPEVFVSHQTHVDGTTAGHSIGQIGTITQTDTKHNVTLSEQDDDGSIKYKTSVV